MKYFWRRNGFIFYLYHYFLEVSVIFTSGNSISPLPQLALSIYCLNLPGECSFWDHFLLELCDGFQEGLIEL